MATAVTPVLGNGRTYTLISYHS